MGPGACPAVTRSLKRVGKEHRIPFQMAVQPRAGGTDAAGIQIIRDGVAVETVSLPLRYMHTPLELGSITDMKLLGALLAEFAALAKTEGKSLRDLLIDTYIEYGYYRESLLSITKKGQSGAEEIRHMMEEYREHPYSSIHGIEVVRIDDILLSTSTDCCTGAKTPIQQPKSDVLQFHLADGSKVTMRPSGTEPKIKFYFSVREKLERREDYDAAVEAAEAKIEGIIQYMKLK